MQSCAINVASSDENDSLSDTEQIRKELKADCKPWLHPAIASLRGSKEVQLAYIARKFVLSFRAVVNAASLQIEIETWDHASKLGDNLSPRDKYLSFIVSDTRHFIRAVVNVTRAVEDERRRLKAKFGRTFTFEEALQPLHLENAIIQVLQYRFVYVFDDVDVAKCEFVLIIDKCKIRDEASAYSDDIRWMFESNDLHERYVMCVLEVMEVSQRLQRKRAKWRKFRERKLAFYKKTDDLIEDRFRMSDDECDDDEAVEALTSAAARESAASSAPADLSALIALLGEDADEQSAREASESVVSTSERGSEAMMRTQSTPPQPTVSSRANQKEAEEVELATFLNARTQTNPEVTSCGEGHCCPLISLDDEATEADDSIILSRDFGIYEDQMDVCVQTNPVLTGCGIGFCCPRDTEMTARKTLAKSSRSRLSTKKRKQLESGVVILLSDRNADREPAEKRTKPNPPAVADFDSDALSPFHKQSLITGPLTSNVSSSNATATPLPEANDSESPQIAAEVIHASAADNVLSASGSSAKISRALILPSDNAEACSSATNRNNSPALPASSVLPTDATFITAVANGDSVVDIADDDDVVELPRTKAPNPNKSSTTTDVLFKTACSDKDSVRTNATDRTAASANRSPEHDTVAASPSALGDALRLSSADSTNCRSSIGCVNFFPANFKMPAALKERVVRYLLDTREKAVQ